MLKKIISGGQTGADLAGIDLAIKFNIPHGGWIPKGRNTEDGCLPDKYQLKVKIFIGCFVVNTQESMIRWVWGYGCSR